MIRLFQGYRPYLVLSFVCLALYLPGLAILPPMDRDEARFAQATRQMLESGDYVGIRYQDEMRAKKPVGAYWAQALSVSSVTDGKSPQIWAHRLPSVLAAWAAVLMTFAFGSHLFDKRTAFFGALLLGASVMVVVEAHLAKTDALLLAAALAAQGSLARVWLAGRGAGEKPSALLPFLFWVAQGCAILIKGPVVPVISLLTIFSLSYSAKDLRWLMGLRPVTGLLVAAAIVMPWASAITQATDGAFFQTAIKTDLLPKILGAQESHGGWPGYYLALISLTFWPGSMLLWPALVKAWQGRAQPVIGFLLAWIIPAWVMFEMIPTKLPHYTLPLYPALALVTAWAVMSVVDHDLFKSKPARLWYSLWALIGLALAAGIPALAILYGQGITLWVIVAALSAAFCALVPAALAWRGRQPMAVVSAVLGALLTFGSLFQGVAPDLDRLRVSQRLAEEIALYRHDGPVAVAGYHEPSLVFLLGTETRLTTAEGAAHHLATHADALAVIEARSLPDFRNRIAQEQNLKIQELAVIAGLNYSRGKDVALHVFAVTP